MLKVAITGNIAAGKSEVEKILAEKYPVYDADKIAHKFLPKGVNRVELGKKVFANPDLRKQLEAEIHPKVKNDILNIFKSTPTLTRSRGEGNLPIIFVSVPLLFEAKFDNMFDKIIFVACDDETRLQRLMKRNNLTKEEALNRINSQQPQEEKIKKSDYVIYNNSSLEELKKQVDLALSNMVNTHHS